MLFGYFSNLGACLWVCWSLWLIFRNYFVRDVVLPWLTVARPRVRNDGVHLWLWIPIHDLRLRVSSKVVVWLLVRIYCLLGICCYVSRSLRVIISASLWQPSIWRWIAHHLSCVSHLLDPLHLACPWLVALVMLLSLGGHLWVLWGQCFVIAVLLALLRTAFLLIKCVVLERPERSSVVWISAIVDRVRIIVQNALKIHIQRLGHFRRRSWIIARHIPGPPDRFILAHRWQLVFPQVLVFSSGFAL